MFWSLLFKVYKKNIYLFFVYIEMVNNYYQKHKERVRKEVIERYQDLSEEEKDQIGRKSWEKYQNFTEEEKEKRHQYYWEYKEKLLDYRKNYYLTHEK